MSAEPEGEARFVVLWGVDAAAVRAARIAYANHSVRCGKSERWDFFTEVQGGSGNGLRPREADTVPLTRIVVCPDSLDRWEWSLFLPTGSWWDQHGSEFLAARPDSAAGACGGG